MYRLMAMLAVAAACPMFLAPDTGAGAGGTAVADPVKKWYLLKKDFMGHKAGEKLEMLEEDADGLVGKTLELCEDNPADGIAETVINNLSQKIGDLVNAAVDTSIKNLKSAKGKGVFSIETKENANEDNAFGYEGPRAVGDFLREVKGHSHRENPRTSERLKTVLKWQANQGQTKAANTDDPMNTQVGEDAGVLMPPTMSNTLYQKTFEENSILSKVDTYNIAGNSIVFPRLKEDSRATGSRYGGITVGWVAEGNNVSGTRPKFDRLTLTLKKLMALVFVTQESLDDAGQSLEQIVMNTVSQELGFAMVDSIFSGDGVGKPLGILTAPAKYVQAAVSGQGAGTVVAANISAMYARMQARSRKAATWYINQEVETELDKLSLAIGTGGSTSPMYLQPGGLTGEAPARLKSRPVETVEFCSALGTLGDILLWEEKGYCFITKGGVKTAMSMHLRFDYDEQVFKFTFRADGAPWWPKPLTPYKGTTQLSNIVVLSSTRT